MLTKQRQVTLTLTVNYRRHLRVCCKWHLLFLWGREQTLPREADADTSNEVDSPQGQVIDQWRDVNFGTWRHQMGP
jgi:hypothetical protein